MEFNFPGKKTSHPEGFYEKTQFTPRRSHTKACLFFSKQGSLFPTEQALTQTHWPRQANDDTEASSSSWRWTHKQAPGTRSDSNELLNLVKFNLFLHLQSQARQGGTPRADLCSPAQVPTRALAAGPTEPAWCWPHPAYTANRNPSITTDLLAFWGTSLLSSSCWLK